jgi:alpha-galactosidase
MVNNGMADLGYKWIVLDDCWHPSRDTNGTLVPYKEFFPNGMKPVIDFVHSLNLSFGLYTSVGDKTCHGGWSPGSYGYYQQDADTFAAWGVDYVKVDWCGSHDTVEGHKNISKAMNSTGRPMVLELCRGDYEQMRDWGYAPGIAQVWRATGDHHDKFSSTLEQVAAITEKHSSGPYGWAYGDMMMTGGEGCDNYDPDKPEHCPKQTDNEYRSEVSYYSVLGSPMMVGTDIRLMTDIMTETLLNAEMLNINQDFNAPVGQAITQNSEACTLSKTAYVRHLSNGSVAVAVTNMNDTHTANVTVCFEDVFAPFCDISLIHTISHHECRAGIDYGCVNSTAMFIDNGCRGTFICNQKEVKCSVDGPGRHICSCVDDPKVKVLEKIVPQEQTVQVRNIWQKTNGVYDNRYSQRLGPHDSLLLVLTKGISKTA